MKRLGYAGIILALLSGPATLAADEVIPMPVGWTPTPGVFSASNGHVAIAAHNSSSDEYEVMQLRDVGVGRHLYRTSIVGEAFSLEYSPDSSYLLVHAVASDGTNAASLIDAQGAIAWTKSVSDQYLEVSGMYEFTRSGDAILAWAPGDEYSSAVLVTYDLSGEFVRRLDVGTNIHAALGYSAMSVVVSVAHGVAKYDLQSASAPIWQVSLASDVPPVQSMRFVGASGDFVIYLQGGYFVVLGSNGSLRYTYDPVALAEGFTSKTSGDLANLFPFQWGGNGDLVLFDGTDDALILDEATWSLSESQISATPPAGYSIPRKIEDDTIVLLGANEVRIRNLRD